MNDTRSTMEQLRDDIDSGRNAEKVAVIDPAAAPLGADEEAAGTPVGAPEIELARVQEEALAAPVVARLSSARLRASLVVVSCLALALISAAVALALALYTSRHR